MDKKIYISLDLEELQSVIIDCVNSCLKHHQSHSHSNFPETDAWFDLNELLKYDPEKRSKQTFYAYVREGKIPHHKRKKKLIFLKSEIDFWLKQGRVQTKDEIEANASNYLNTRKGKNNG